MMHQIHALDSFFYTSMGVYKFQSQCEMLAELGFDGITVSAWGGTPYTDLAQLPSVKSQYGLNVSGLYLVLHEGRNDSAIQRIVESVEGVELIELAVQTTVNGMGSVIHFIESLLPIVERRRMRIALYPHLRHVTETTSQVVKLCQHFNHSRLGASFNGYHWYASGEGQLEKKLQALKPWLMQVVLSGSSLSPLGWGGVATMEPLDRGELDNSRIITALHQIGYTGSIGILGWDYGGDVYSKLQRCLRNLQKISQRQSSHPLWQSHPAPR
ncbi:sugar phosphate isomerase/epimerase [Rahnella sp. RcJ3]|uniref:sugar phosphate isomerase/epimerase family protein n=1 Tax=Rahnella sp. RcJ3 TaxID=2292446 RepID=UPI001297D194|nr:TIM barrel protein [Rahnella sp. RcJ3]MQB56063.1 xylose isomerase [Rahnella sp. RcJ3]